jgi:hypothetical protein
MFRLVSFITGCLFCSFLWANDSLKIKDKRFIVGIDISKTYSAYHLGAPQFDKMSNWYGGKLRGMYIIPGTPRRNLAAGFDASFTSVYLSEKIPDIEQKSSYDYFAFVYEPNVIKTRNTNGCLGIFVSIFNLKKHFYISHDLGMRFSFFTKNEIDKTYKETYSASGQHYSYDSISSNNPSGFYYYDIRTVREIKERYNFYNTMIPFYNLDIGMRFRNVIPHVSFELTYYKDFLKVESERFVNDYILKGAFFKINMGIAFGF